MLFSLISASMNSRFVERAAKIRPLFYLPNFSFEKPDFFYFRAH